MTHIVLNKLKFLLNGYYKPDLAEGVQKRWKETSIKISMISILDKYHQYLATHLDPEVSRTLKALNSDFSSYVQRKIEGETMTELDDLRLLVSLAAQHNLEMVVYEIGRDIQASSLPEETKMRLVQLTNAQKFKEAQNFISTL